MKHCELVVGMPVWWRRISGPGGKIKATVARLPTARGKVGIVHPYTDGLIWVQARHLTSRGEVDAKARQT